MSLESLECASPCLRASQYHPIDYCIGNSFCNAWRQFRIIIRLKIFSILSWSYWSDNQIKCIFAQILEYSFRVNFDLHSCFSRSSHMIEVTWFIFIISSLSSRPIYFLLGSGWIIKTILEHVRIWNMTFCWLFCIHDIITSRNLIFGPISGMVK